MGDYSQSPQELLRKSREKGYVGIHVEQGVPILDRDLNLLQDLMAATMREVFTRYIGNGTAHGNDGFSIEALPAQNGENRQDFRISTGADARGSCLVGGIEVTITQPIRYSAQRLPKLTTPNENRSDLVYLDVTLVEEDGINDDELFNSDDVGLRTSVRLKPAWVVRVAEGQETVPERLEGHSYHPLALLVRPMGKDTIEQSDIHDRRTRGLTVSDVESRLSRVERMLALPAFTGTPEFMPKSGVVNQSVTINGKNFDVGTVKVFFGGEEAELVAGTSAKRLVARVPAGLTPGGAPVSVEVAVRNEVGTATAATLFRVDVNPLFAPPGGQFSPNHGIPQTEVVLSGFNFNASDLKVFFGTKQAEVMGTPSPTEVRVRVPEGLVVGTQSVDVHIKVTTAAGEVTSEDLFKAEPVVPKPTFATVPFTPKLGQVDQPVTLHGTNFAVGGLKVFFGDKEAPVEVPPTPTTIATRVPTGLQAGQVVVKVQTAGGETDSTPKMFTIQT
ncbi:IPT/TIG domain-containing protein [Streptomyces iakyrus]|uniref:IPT/TIG domain-containing protein n=1 Tax=Streptomyces iakyrus TaxID=68219 RepID=UPI0038254635